VLFDMDGTLVDSLSDIASSMNHVLAAHAMPTHPIDAYRTLVGEGASQLVWRAIPERERARAHEQLLAEYKARYRGHLIVESRPYEGIEALLEGLEARAIAKAVVTNKPRAAAAQIVERLLGRFRWASVEGQVDGVPHKPDPTMALAAASACAIDPACCFFVGDSSIDMETARRASMIAVGCTWGFRAREELVSSGAAHLIDHPRDLLALLDPR
jgi:phosphoglycolate phosphatase